MRAMKTAAPIKNIDRDIVAELQQNGRATNQQIAERLGLTATTVAGRIRKMEAADQLRVFAVSDFSAHGYSLLMQLMIEVEGRAASEVIEELAAFPEVFAAHQVTGRYDIDMLVVMRDVDDLPPLLLEKIASVHGIRSAVPSIAVDIVKYQFDVAPIGDE